MMVEMSRSGGPDAKFLRPRRDVVATEPDLRVLTWHSISDQQGDPVLEPFAVPLAEWIDQLDVLDALGCSFVTPDEALAHIRHGQSLPPRAVLLHFDDA